MANYMRSPLYEVGDKVLSNDFRSNYWGKVGVVIDVVNPHRIGCCLTVQFGKGTEATGAQWYRHFVPDTIEAITAFEREQLRRNMARLAQGKDNG